MARDLGSPRRRRLLERAVGHHLRDESDAQRLGRVDPAPGEQQVARVSAAEDVEEPRYAIARVEAERDLGKPEVCRLLGDAEVLGGGEHASTAQRIPAHGGDGDLRRRANRSMICCHRSDSALASMALRPGISAISLPAQKARPRPLTSTTRDVGGALDAFEPLLESIRHRAVEALSASGRSRVRRATAPSTTRLALTVRRSSPCVLGRSLSENAARAMRRVQLRGGARRQPARRTLCGSLALARISGFARLASGFGSPSVSRLSRAPTKQMGPYHRSSGRLSRSRK